MKIILLTKVKNLGSIGELVTVKSGYARNYLLPKEKAIIATKQNINIVENKKIAMELKLSEKLKIAYNRVEKINAINDIVIKAKSGEEGKLFGSIGARDIAASISSLGVLVNKNEIRLPHGVLRNIGEHIITFHPHNDVRVNITIKIISDVVNI
ncbi:MAG TPA: 50S ribosomal protein L9 [Buchnera sp. (in: enterobacteria)]|nr:50S ribosomal protein L9 [Buchnera sp. (in: enterobacteria)]